MLARASGLDPIGIRPCIDRSTSAVGHAKVEHLPLERNEVAAREIHDFRGGVNAEVDLRMARVQSAESVRVVAVVSDDFGV